MGAEGARCRPWLRALLLKDMGGPLVFFSSLRGTDWAGGCVSIGTNGHGRVVTGAGTGTGTQALLRLATQGRKNYSRRAGGCGGRIQGRVHCPLSGEDQLHVACTVLYLEETHDCSANEARTAHTFTQPSSWPFSCCSVPCWQLPAKAHGRRTAAHCSPLWQHTRAHTRPHADTHPPVARSTSSCLRPDAHGTTLGSVTQPCACQPPSAPQ